MSFDKATYWARRAQGKQGQELAPLAKRDISFGDQVMLGVNKFKRGNGANPKKADSPTMMRDLKAEGWALYVRQHQPKSTVAGIKKGLG